MDERGRFAPGNKLGKGNPLGRRMTHMRMVFMSAVTELDIQMLAKSMLAAANAGDVAAARLICEYNLGKVKPVDDEKDDEARQALVIAPPEPMSDAG